MAEYTYKGYVADVYEDKIPGDWFSTFYEPSLFKVSLMSDFGRYESEACLANEMKTIRHIYMKYFEQSVDKHLSRFK